VRHFAVQIAKVLLVVSLDAVVFKTMQNVFLAWLMAQYCLLAPFILAESGRNGETYTGGRGDGTRVALRPVQCNAVVPGGSLNGKGWCRMATIQVRDCQQRIDEMTEAFNRHDGRAVSEFYTDDGDLIDPWGKLSRGKRDIQSYWSRSFSGQLKNATHTATVRHIDQVGSDVIVVDCEGQVSGLVDSSGNELPERDLTLTLTMVHRNGKWLVAAARAFFYSSQPSGVAVGQQYSPAAKPLNM